MAFVHHFGVHPGKQGDCRRSIPKVMKGNFRQPRSTLQRVEVTRQLSPLVRVTKFVHNDILGDRQLTGLFGFPRHGLTMIAENITRPAVEGQHPPARFCLGIGPGRSSPSPGLVPGGLRRFSVRSSGEGRGPVRAQLGGKRHHRSKRPDGGAHWSLGTLACPEVGPCIALGAANVTGRDRAMVYRSLLRFTDGGGRWGPVLAAAGALPTCTGTSY